MQPPRLIWIDIVSLFFAVGLTLSGQPSSFPHPPPCSSFMASSDVICRFLCPYMAKDDVFVYRFYYFFYCWCLGAGSLGSKVFLPTLWNLPRIGELRLIGALVIAFSLLLYVLVFCYVLLFFCYLLVDFYGCVLSAFGYVVVVWKSGFELWWSYAGGYVMFAFCQDTHHSWCSMRISVDVVFHLLYH